jgi:hypothetical protein
MTRHSAPRRPAMRFGGMRLANHRVAAEPNLCVESVLTDAMSVTDDPVCPRHADNNGEDFILNVGQIIREAGNDVHG